MSLRLLLIILLGILPLLVYAENKIYRHQNPDGSVTYSDQPGPGSKEILLWSDPVVDKPSKGKLVEPAKPGKEPKLVPAKEYYKKFTISDPADGLTFHNQRKIRITLSIDPELREGDTLQLVLDNKDYGSPTTDQQIYLNQVERGSHTVQARIIDDKGNVIKVSKKITIYIHYASLGGKRKQEKKKK